MSDVWLAGDLMLPLVVLLLLEATVLFGLYRGVARETQA